MKSKIEVAKSSIHGRGVFAKKRIRAGARIGRYEGEQTRTDGRYVLWIYDEDGLARGVRGTNDLRFLNHSSRPNAEFDDDVLYARETIEPGTEITFDYGW